MSSFTTSTTIKKSKSIFPFFYQSSISLFYLLWLIFYGLGSYLLLTLLSLLSLGSSFSIFFFSLESQSNQILLLNVLTYIELSRIISSGITLSLSSYRSVWVYLIWWCRFSLIIPWFYIVMRHLLFWAL